MAENDDLISKILKEDSIGGVDVNPIECDVNDLLNPSDDGNNILNSILNENITDNLDIPELKENSENKDNPENKENPENVENKENIEKQENKESLENKGDSENKENSEKNENEEKKEGTEIKDNSEKKETEDKNNADNKEATENKENTEKAETKENQEEKKNIIKEEESQINNEEISKKIEQPKPSIENILKESEKKEENIDNLIVDNLDDEINKILNEKSDDMPSITSPEIKSKAQKEIENEIKDATKSFNLEEKDLEIKQDIEKILQEEKNKKLKEDEKKKKKEAEQKMLKSFYTPFKNTLDFVQYLEFDRIYGQISNEMKNFSLNNQIKQDNKYDVSQIGSLFQINNILSKYSINFISAKNTNLIVVTNDGQFLFFSMQPEKLIKRVIPKNLKSTNITCLDITDDYNDMLVGFQDGTIILINVSSQDIKYTNNKIHKDSSIVELKIYKKEKNDLSFISTGSNGDIFLNCLKMVGFSSLFWRMTTTKININNTSPIFLVKFIQFSQENQRLYSNLKKLRKYVILGSTESLWIYCVDPIKEVFEMQKPSFIKETVVPDAQIGIGRPPDVFMRFVKKDERNHLLLIISWGKIIYFYQMPIIDGDSIESYKEVGYYINLFNILRIGFMNNSVIYVLDKSFSIKVLDSSKINPGKINLDKGQPVIPAKNNLSEIEKSRLVSAKISSQKKIFGSNNEKLDTYLYSIVESEDSISSVVVLGDNQIYLVNLIDWLFFLEYLQKKEDFINMFSVGIEIFKGKMMCFSNIPAENIKKKKVGDKLSQLVNQYVVFNTKDKKTNEFLMDEGESQEKIGNCIKTTIEFCIEIEAFDYLINSILPPLDSKDYGDLFFLKLQPFILCDKVKNFNLSTNLILRIIDLYNKNDKLDILSSLLLHINIKSLDNFEIRNKLEEMNLITPLIYLYMNGQYEDYFLPLEKLFEYFYSKSISNKALYDEDNKLIDYSKALTQNLLTEKNVRESKEYNGHKILWYIRWCLTGKKFPDNTIKMEPNKFEKLVPRMTYWLLVPKVIDEFLRFDPKNYFMIHKNIFSIPDLRKKIINAAKDPKYTIEIKSMLSASEVKIDNIEPASLIRYLMEWCKKKNDLKVNFFLYDFIIGYLKSDIDADKELKEQAICFTVTYYTMVVKDKNNQEMSLMNQNLIQIIAKESKFNEDDFKLILDSIKDKDFDDLKLYLYDRLDNFMECLDLYLVKNLNLSEKRDEIVYNWIDNKLNALRGKEDKFNSFVNAIENHTMDLAVLSIKKFIELSKDIFSRRYKQIVERLKEDKNIQLKFIENLIKQIITQYENNEDNVPPDEMIDIKYILDRHISLLCELGQHNRIIPAVKECSFYPLSNCLSYCEKAKAYEPCLFLYIKAGANDKAFDMATEKLNESINKIINNINEEKDFDEIIIEFYKYLNDIKKICENNDLHLQELWFKILTKFYEYEKRANELLKINKFISKKKKLTEKLSLLISTEIKELLEKMCSFVSVTEVLNFVSENNKDAGFKEFRELITKLLGSYGNFTNILYSTRKLLTNSILSDEMQFQKINLKGDLLNAKQCDLCKKEFEEIQGKKEYIIVFNCNHIFHKECIVKNKQQRNVECPLCKDLDIGLDMNKGKSFINKKNVKIEQDTNDSNKFQVKVGASARKALQKLEKYDNRSLEKHVLMINNSITVLKDEYRKEYK